MEELKQSVQVNQESRVIGLLLWLIGSTVPLPSISQVAPTASEVLAASSLHAAAWAGNVSELRRLLAEGSVPDPRDRRGRTPLHIAIFAQHREAISLLAEAGADLNALENDRYDAVTIAAVANDEETLALLLDLGARADQITSRYDGTALIAAAHLAHVGVVRRLIAAGAPLNHINNLHWTAVIESVVLGDGGTRHVATLKALVDAGAEVSIGDRDGTLPLEMARSRGYTEMVRIIEAANAP